jgi:hypothetical protein
VVGGIRSGFAASLLVVGIAVADRPEPLTDEHRRIVFGSAEDVLDPIEKTNHFVHANECKHQVWKPFVKGVAGAYLGIGTDQNFTLIAWARSELAFLMDYDPVVVHVNHAHRALLEHSADIAGYVARFSAAGKVDAEAILNAVYATHPERREIVAAFRRYRGRIARHYARVLREADRENHFLHDDADYAHVHRLAETDRIRVLKGDLLQSTTMRGVGRVSAQLDLPVRVVYLSNAEEFWSYPAAFRDNVASLTMDPASVVLRTRHTDIYGARLDDFVYVAEDGIDFRSKLQMRTARGRWRHRGIWSLLLDRRPVAGIDGLFTVGPVETRDDLPPVASLAGKRCYP